MRTTTGLSLKQAAEAIGKSKPTVLRAIQKGKLSAEKDDNGQYVIEPSELFRVFPQVTGEPLREAEPVTVRNGDETAVFRREIERLEAERTRERQQLETTIADLRRRLDEETEERRRAHAQITALLTDQRPRGEQKKQEAKPSSFLGWIRGR